jgi:glycosyltransferase involved in cell wall biosynthesis
MRTPRVRRGRTSADRPIRLAFLTPTLDPGGAERQMLILAALLPRDQFEIRFIAMFERGAWAIEADRLGIPVHLLGIPRSASPRRPQTVLAIARALQRYVALTRDVDIVDAWLIPSFTFAGLAQPLARVPVLLAGRRSSLDLYVGKPWYRRAAAGWVSRRADAVVANSAAARRDAIEREGVDPTRVALIPNAVIPVDPDPADRSRRRREWGFADDDIVVGCVANYKTGKGLETIVEAAGRLRMRVRNLRFVLVGEGPLRGPLLTKIGQADLGSIVVLNGALSDARRVYAAFDIAVQASDSEGLPNAVLEAAAAGRPIVATDVGGTSEIIGSPDAFLFRPGDADALTAALERLADDPGLRRSMGERARVSASRFSADALVAKTAALYLRLLGVRPGA